MTYTAPTTEDTKMKKELKALISLLKNAGCTVTLGRTHYKATNAYGQCSFSTSPSDVRALRNIRRDIKQGLGFDIRIHGSNI